MAEKYREEEKAALGGTLRTEFGRDRSDDDPGDTGSDKEEMNGRLTGEGDDASSQVKGSKVPKL